MNNIWIFGDVWSAPYSIGDDNFPKLAEYIEEERLEGVEEVRDLNWWIQNLTNSEYNLINTSHNSWSNESILEKLYQSFSLMKKGDKVIVQFAPGKRFRVVHSKEDHLWFEVQTPIHEEVEQPLSELTYWNKELAEQAGFERDHIQWRKSLYHTTLFVKEALSLKGVDSAIASVDPEYRKYTDLPEIYWSSESEMIVDKFPHIREAFPTYKGYEFIATEYLKFLKVL